MTSLAFSGHALFQIVLYLVLLPLVAVPFGNFMAKVYSGERHLWSRVLGGVERLIYKVCGVDPASEMNWKQYATALVAFNFVGLLAVLLIQMFQASLPLNPQKLPNVPFALALNTAISFMTNTNWQAYSGESTLSYFTQMLGLTVQNFVSAASGMAVIVALARGFTRRLVSDLGNFWCDLVRSTLYILLPLSILVGVFLVGQGVVQNVSPYVDATTVEGAKQTLPFGPAASQIAIKQIGTNGGGFFGANSAHPFENPTPLSNFVEMFLILMIPAAMVYMFGKLVGAVREGWSIFAAMMAILTAGVAVAVWAEYQLNPATGGLPFLEGKELRFGIGGSALWAVVTSAASNGSVNAMHDSLSPLAGFVAMLNLKLGEVIFGGVGAGMYGMLMFVILTVFIAGLMVGRTPEYLGKKIEAREIILAAIAVLAPSIIILSLSAWASLSELGLSSLGNKGPHGLSEILYAFASAVGNNGSAFGGLNANTNFYNYATGFSMLMGRFMVIIPALAIAGSVVVKKKVPQSLGTFPTDGILFTGLLICVVLIVGALTFFPALALGPLAEHLLLPAGRLF